MHIYIHVLVHSVYGIVLHCCSATFKYPWARCLCYKGGLGKNGQQQLQEVIRYPSEVTNHYCGPTYPSIVLPFNRIHLKVGGCSVCPSRKLQTLSIPADFPLSLAFIHVLCTHSLKSFRENPTSHTTLQCSQALSVALVGLSHLITRLEMPQILKERTLHLFSELLWTLCTVAPDHLSLYSLSDDFMQGIRQEVMSLYELEIRKFSKSKQKTNYPPVGSISEGGQGKFSIYLQSIVECLLAMSTYQHKFHRVDPDTSISSSSSSSSLSVSSMSQPQTAATAGKKSSVRRFRSRRGGSGGGGAGGGGSSGGKKDAGDTDPKKREEWFGLVKNASLVLTSLTSLDPPPTLSSSSYHTEHHVVHLPQDHLKASLNGSLPAQPNCRLIVVAGICTDLPVLDIEKRLRRVCQPFGGLFKDQIYLPVTSTTSPLQSSGDRDNNPIRHSDHSTIQEGVSDSTAEGQSTDMTSDRPQDPSKSEDDVITSSRKQFSGHAVLELSCSSNISAVCDAITKLTSLQASSTGGVAGVKTPLAAMTVNSTLNLVCEDEVANRVLIDYLKKKLVDRERVSLTSHARQVFQSMFDANFESGSSAVAAAQEGRTKRICDGELLLFLTGFSGGKTSGKEAGDIILRDIMSEREEGESMCVEDFLNWCYLQAMDRSTHVWQGLFACGYDLHFTR